jgi:hypothetical protein
MVTSSPGQQEVIKRCLQGEEASVDVQGVRERVLRIGRVGQVIRDGDALSASIFTVWLIGLFLVLIYFMISSLFVSISSAEGQLTAVVVTCRGGFGNTFSTIWGCCVAVYFRRASGRFVTTTRQSAYVDGQFKLWNARD